MDISIIVNAHDEGAMLSASVASALASTALFQAAFSEADVEIMVILDSPSRDTTRVSGTFPTSVKVQQTEFRDVSMARNYAVGESSGKFIAFLDGDDLFGLTWILNCWVFMSKQPLKTQTILHPQYNYYFGSGLQKHESTVFEHVSSTSANFNGFTLATSNYWSALAFASREVFETHPYKSSTELFGFEDWSFNNETIANGYSHLAVAETVHFLRTKGTSSRRKTESAKMLTFHPTKLWRLLSLSAVNEYHSGR